MSANRPGRRPALIILCFFVFLSYALTCHAETSSEPNRAPSFAAGISGSGGGGGVGGSGTVLPDLFTGTMSYSIPIEVVPGRKGMQPNLALTYRSNNGNGWVGVGWDLEIGAIERSTRNGIAFNDSDSYILRLNGSSIDLLYIGSNEYRAKIEGAFLKIEKLTSSPDGHPYWKVTDKTGRWHRFGYYAESRQDNPVNGSYEPNYRIFKWCLDRVEDTNGNYMNIWYTKAGGQVYPWHIDYAGNSITNTAPANYVALGWESRTAPPVMYATNFAVWNVQRLTHIDVMANGQYPGGTLVQRYELAYDYSAGTGRSLLKRVRKFDKNAQNSLPAMTFAYTSKGSTPT